MSEMLPTGAIAWASATHADLTCVVPLVNDGHFVLAPGVHEPEILGRRCFVSLGWLKMYHRDLYIRIVAKILVGTLVISTELDNVE